MNNVVNYTAVTASQDVSDMYDADNFYPADGVDTTDYEEYDEYGSFSGLDADGNEMDAEFSEVLGGLFKKKSTPRMGGATGGTERGQFGSKVKGLITNRREGLDDRLSSREQNLSDRKSRRDKRSTARQTRRNMRQVQLVQTQPPVVQENMEKIVVANTPTNPQLRESVDLTAMGEANAAQEQQTQVVVTQAQKMFQEGETSPPLLEIDVATGNVTQVKDTWWKKQSTGVKIAIIGGSALLLGLGIFAIVKSRKKN